MTDDSPFLDLKGTRWVQSAIGSCLYYARALDNTILATLNQLGTQQALPTENTKKAVKHLLDYVYTYRQTYLQFNASDMILHVDSDAAYLVLPKARSRIAGFFRLRNKQNNTHKQENGAILVECKALRWVVTSAAEAETHGVYHNTIITINLRTILNGMGHSQPITPVQTNNSTTEGFTQTMNRSSV